MTAFAGRSTPAAAGEALDGGGGVAAAAGGQRHHQRAAQAERRQHQGGDERVAQGERAGRDDPERHDHLVGQEPEAQAGAVGQAPDGERPLAAPPLRHLLRELGERQAQPAGLAQRPEQREDAHHGEGDVLVEVAADRAERRAERGGGGDRAHGEEGDGDLLAVTAPAHVGGDGLDHGEASGAPGARDARDERRGRDADLR